MVWDKLSLQKLNKGSLVYSQAEGQGLPGPPLSMIIITKAMESKSKKQLHCGVKIGFFPASVTPGSQRGARAHLLKLFAGDFGTYCLLSTGESLLMLSTLKNKKVKVKSLSRVRLFATRGLYCSPPNSSVHGILQARILEWVAISFSRRSSRPRDLSRECMFLGSLSRHNKDLEQRTLKRSARTALGSWRNRATALRQISVTALFYVEDSRRERERERKKRAQAPGRESP